MLFVIVLFKSLLILFNSATFANPVPPYIGNNNAGNYRGFYINPGFGNVACFPNVPDYTQMHCTDGSNIPIYRTLLEGSRLYLYGYSHRTQQHYTWAVARPDIPFQRPSSNMMNTVHQDNFNWQMPYIPTSPVGFVPQSATPFTNSANSVETDSPKSQQDVKLKKSDVDLNYDSDDSLEIILDEEFVNSYEPEWFRALLEQKKVEEAESSRLDSAIDEDVENLENDMTDLTLENAETSETPTYTAPVEQFFPMKQKSKVKKTKVTKTKSLDEEIQNDEVVQNGTKQKPISRKEREKMLKEQKRQKKGAELGQAAEKRKEQQLLEKEQQRQEYLRRINEQLMKQKDEDEAKISEQQEDDNYSVKGGEQTHLSEEIHNFLASKNDAIQQKDQDSKKTEESTQNDDNEESGFVPLVPDISIYLSKIMKGDAFLILQEFFKKAKRELPKSFSTVEDMDHVMDIMENGHDDRSLQINSFIAPYFAVRAMINDDLDVVNNLLEKIVKFTEYLDIRYEEIKKRKEKVRVKPLFIYLKTYHADAKAMKKIRALISELKPQLDLLNRTVPFSVSLLAKYKELQYRYGEEEMNEKFTTMTSIRVQVKIAYEFLQKVNMFYEGFKDT